MRICVVCVRHKSILIIIIQPGLPYSRTFIIDLTQRVEFARRFEYVE